MRLNAGIDAPNFTTESLKGEPVELAERREDGGHRLSKSVADMLNQPVIANEAKQSTTARDPGLIVAPLLAMTS